MIFSLMDSGHNNETSKTTFVEEVLSIQPGIQRARPHIERTEDPMIFTQWDRDLYFTKWWPLIYVLGASFGAIHLISWNSTFLTPPPPLRAVALALKRAYFCHHVHHLHAIQDRIPPMGRPAYDSPRFCPDSLHQQPCRDDGGGLCSFEGHASQHVRHV